MIGRVRYGFCSHIVFSMSILVLSFGRPLSSGRWGASIGSKLTEFFVGFAFPAMASLRWGHVSKEIRLQKRAQVYRGGPTCQFLTNQKTRWPHGGFPGAAERWLELIGGFLGFRMREMT